MKDLIEATFLSSLLFTFLIPGLTLALLLIPKKKISLTLFLTYAVVLGFFSQLVIGLVASFSGQLFNDPTLNIGFVALLFISGLLITLFKCQKDKLKNLRNLIQISSYDVAVIILMTIVMALFLSNIKALDRPYFNPGTDQYMWLGQAESLLEDPMPLFIKTVHPFSIYKHSFSYILATLVPFVEKTVNDYQNLIIFWSCLFYGLFVLIGAQLGRSIFKSSVLGLLTPLLILSFHWDNYYLISAGIVPQNIGMLLFIFGFILLNHLQDWKDEPRKGVILSVIYLSIFYLIHSPSLVIFLLSLGLANILIFILSFISQRLGKKPIKQKLTVLSLFAIPIVVIAAIRYLLYYTRFLSFNDPATIGKYQDYIKTQSIFSHPYMTWHETTIIWLAIIGFTIIALKIIIEKKSDSRTILLGSFIILFWIFNTLELAYFAIYASWQVYRFKLFIYPAFAIGALTTAHFLFLLLRQRFLIASKLLTILFIVIVTPQLLVKINNHQNLVILDMIRGRDEKISTMKNYEHQVRELLDANKLITKDKNGIVLFITKKVSQTYGNWAFAPHKFYSTSICRSYNKCLVKDSINGKTHLSGIDADLIILEKNPELINNLSKDLVKEYKNKKESSLFIFYYN